MKNHGPVFALLAQSTPNAEILTRDETLAQWVPVFVPVCYKENLACLCGHMPKWGYMLTPRFSTGENFGIIGKECLRGLYPEITEDHLALGRLMYSLEHDGQAHMRKKDGCTDGALELAIRLGMLSRADVDMLKDIRSFRHVPRPLLADCRTLVHKMLTWPLTLRKI